MKKVLSLLLVSVLAVGNVGFAATAPKVTTKAPAPVVAVKEVTKTAVVVGYTENTMTVKEDGKNVTYKLDAKTKVVSLGMEATYADIIFKGMKVTFKAKGNVLTFVDIPSLGQQTQGTMGPLTVTDVRINTTDDAALPANSATTTYTRADKGVIASTDYTLSDDMKTISIGQFEAVPASIKLTVGDRTIKLVDKFDAKVDNDEATFAFAKNVSSITLEKALTADEAKLVKLNYDRKEWYLTATEVSKYVPAMDMVVELNGKPVSLFTAMDRGTFNYVTTNTVGEIIYVNSMYKEMQVRVVKADAKKISFYVEKAGKIAFYDSVELDPGVTILGKDGAEIKATDLKPYDLVELTVDPALGYKASLLVVK